MIDTMKKFQNSKDQPYTRPIQTTNNHIFLTKKENNRSVEGKLAKQFFRIAGYNAPNTARTIFH